MSEFVDDDEPEEVSEEEMIAIAKHFLMSAPPAQFTEVLAEVRKLLPSNLLTEEFVKNIARQHNLKHGVVVKTPDGSGKMLVCKEGEVDEGNYVDNGSGAVVGMDHVTRKTQASELEVPIIRAMDPIRQEIGNHLATYVNNSYETPDRAFGVYATSETQLVARIVGQKASPRSMWSGKWSSVWTIDLVNSTSAVVSGSIAIMVHYYEDGNIQMNTAKKCPEETFEYTSETMLTSKVLEVIKKREDELSAGLSMKLVMMNDVTFKAMRRILPVTRTKMDWNVNAHKMAKAVSKK